MGENAQVFERHGSREAWEKFLEDGTEEGVLRIPADQVLDAIARGMDIDIKYAIINGDLDIRKIGDQLERDEEGRQVLKGKILISYSEVRGEAYFRSAQFSGKPDFREAYFGNSTNFGRAAMENPADFSGVRLRENTVPVGLWNLGLGRTERLHLSVTDFTMLDTETVMDGSSNPWLKRYIEDQQWIESWRASARKTDKKGIGHSTTQSYIARERAKSLVVTDFAAL